MHGQVPQRHSNAACGAYGSSRKQPARDAKVAENEDNDPSQRSEEHVWDIVAYCRQAGIDEAEERRLLKVLGRYASSHELQINIIRPKRPSR